MKGEMTGATANMPLIDNAFAGIVLTAQTFNPSVFTESWLTQNDILSADSFAGVRVFSPEIAQFHASGVQVVVVPPMMQIIFGIPGTEGSSELPRKIARRTVELLPHTPFQALGINFDFFIAAPAGEDFNRLNRSLMGTGTNNLIHEFSTPDAKFGRYFSMNYGDGRVKLDIKPVQGGPEKKDLMQFSFNFHHEVSHLAPLDRVTIMLQLIERWASFREYASRLVQMGLLTEVEVHHGN